ncbi:TIGR02302 family protein [Mesorhizobium sp. IMUNJ 23232]|uniref:TIGR02302 family protein n=1 Tax=Mesorhizobium sp. IMUNJ 23232 TaxID=3376064 RepID=UPI00379CBAC6
MKETLANPEKPIFSRRLKRTRLVTRAAMMLERLWPLILPLLVTLSLFASLSWFGVFRLLPDTARFVLLAVVALAALGSLYPLRFYRNPRPDEIDRRIEAANALDHTPLRAQTDRPAGNETGFAQALWREHQKRMAEKLAGAGSDLPRTGVPERDPWGLRAIAVLLLVTAFAYSFGPRGGSLEDGFRAVALTETLPPRIDAWVTPPPYTGKAPIFLTAENNADTPLFTVPTGSDVALRVTGGAGDEQLAFTGKDGTVRDVALADTATPAPASDTPSALNIPAAPRQFEGKLTADGVLALRAGDGEQEVRSWTFAVVPDKPPVIRFSDEPKRAVNGAFELRYEIEDDYGAASAKADFALEETPAADARPLYGPPEMPLSVPRRGAHDITMKATRDLTEHVWAGSRIKLTLSTVDDAGQEAKTETKTIVLPERPFTNPLARAVVELRKILSLDANQKRRVVDLIDAITLRPEDTFDNPSYYLGIMAGRTRLQLASTDDALRDVSDYLWNMALQIEDGDLSTAEKNLRQAQEALKQALRDGASDEEIDRLMKELRQAMNEFLREFAERAARDPNLAQQQPQPGQELSQSDLERMMDQIENLAKSGNRQQAEELLSQLQDMMNNLQARRQQRPGEGGQESEMRQQMNKLGEIMRRQQEMMNETFRMDQMQRGEQQRGQNRQQQRGNQGQQGQQGEGQQGQGMTPEEFAEALKQLQQGQGQLGDDLEALMKGLEGMGIQPGEGFGEAGEAMDQAEGALGDGDGGRATGEQGRALEALRKGAQDMMQQMQQAMEGDQGGGEEGGRRQTSDRDPLGRPRATNGPDDGSSVKVPDEIDMQRARQILEAIRKRLGNALSPELERSYLERLLKLE